MSTTSDNGSNMIQHHDMAIVGCGQIVTHHLHAIHNRLQHRIRIRALVDPNADNRRRIRTLLSGNISESQHPPILEWDRLEDCLTSCPAIAIYFLAVPHDLHESLTSLALQHDKIVILEKPLAPTLASCQALLAQEKGMLIVAEQSPFWEEVSHARALIDAGAIGHRILTASSYYYESMRDNITSGSVTEQGGLGWRGSLERAGGGIVLDGGLHWIRPLRHMLQAEIQHVMGVVQGGTNDTDLQPQLQMEGESLAHALLKMGPAQTNNNDSSSSKVQPPLLATYSAHMLATAPMAHAQCPYFRITGTEGELVIHGNGLFPDGGGGLTLYNAEYPHGHAVIDAKDRQGGFFLGFGHLWVEIYRILNEHDTVAARATVVEAAADVSVALALYRAVQRDNGNRPRRLSRKK